MPQTKEEFYRARAAKQRATIAMKAARGEHSLSQLADEGFDPYPTLPEGEDRRRFNLGDGARWMVKPWHW